MKEKDVIRGKELERINNELFGSFDPEDESWIGGYRVTNTGTATYSPSGYDAIMDLDIAWEE
jgi:hypothetical protein